MATTTKKSSPSDSSITTFRDPIYTITTSINDHAIYIKLVNNVSYMCYEGNFDTAAFKLPFHLKEIHKFVNKCFANETELNYEPGYNVNMQLDNGTLTLGFEGIVGGFLTVQFDLRLREKLMSNDAQLTINFQRIEHKQQHAFEEIAKRMAEMERRLEALGHSEICFYKGGQFKTAYPIDSKSLIIDDSNTIGEESFKKIKYFYQLEELTMSSCSHISPQTHVSNATVKKLTLNSSPAFTNITFINNFPSLVELSMIGFSVNSSIVTTLRSIKHKIRKLKFQGCGGINQTEMQTYCTQTGIELNLS